VYFRKFLTIEHVPRITTFCICIYVFGCRLSLFRLCDSDFGIIPLAEITIGTTCTASCFHITRIIIIIVVVVVVVVVVNWAQARGQCCTL
jgi:hypothetical protein